MTVTEAEHRAAVAEKKWAVTEASDGSWHVHPLGDFRGHYIERGDACWCGPRVDGERLFIHNSADGREEHE